MRMPTTPVTQLLRTGNSSVSPTVAPGKADQTNVVREKLISYITRWRASCATYSALRSPASFVSNDVVISTRGCCILTRARSTDIQVWHGARSQNPWSVRYSYSESGALRLSGRYNRQGRKANVGAGTATATEPTREHKQYATQGPTTYLCT